MFIERRLNPSNNVIELGAAGGRTAKVALLGRSILRKFAMNNRTATTLTTTCQKGWQYAGPLSGLLAILLLSRRLF